jgi:hypothetical protein
MRARREGYAIEDRARDYFFRTRDGECRKRSGGPDKSGQDAFRGAATLHDSEEFRRLCLGEFRRPSRFALMIDAHDEARGVARVGLRRVYIATARRAPRLVPVLEKSRRRGRCEASRDFEDRRSESNRIGATIFDPRAHDRPADRVLEVSRDRQTIADRAGLMRVETYRARVAAGIEVAEFDSREECVRHVLKRCKDARSRQGTRRSKLILQRVCPPSLKGRG